jgi:hypothetical protein
MAIDQYLKKHIVQEATSNGWNGKIIVGLAKSDIKNSVDSNEDFLYIDHAYFNRGWENKNFRLIRNWVHLNRLNPRPDDRFKKFGIEIEPWRKTGGKIVVIPHTEYQEAIGARGWTESILEKLKAVTQRKVVVKWAKGGLREFLDDAWCVITWASAAGVDATLMGIPVFAHNNCPAYPVSAGPIENVDFPVYAENRYEWACSLSYASWNVDDVGIIRFEDYDYSYR